MAKKKTTQIKNSPRPRDSKGKYIKKNSTKNVETKSVTKYVSPDLKNMDATTINSLSAAIEGFNFAALGAQLSKTDTLYKNLRGDLVSNARQLLSQMYVEHGLIQTIVDVPVDDALRGGFVINSKQMDEDDIEALKASMEEDGDFNQLAEALKWERLYGGGGLLIMTGEDPATPLDIDSFKGSDKLEFRAVDMWELLGGGGVEEKKSDGPLSKPLGQHEYNDYEFYNYYGVQVHNTRVLKLSGKEAPSFIRPRLRGWGMSVVEPLVRSINQYLKANDVTFEILDEFKIDVYKIKGLSNSLVSGAGTEQIRKRTQLANEQKNFQNAITMDAEDDFSSKEVTFQGLADTLVGIRMHVASDLRMPLTKIFGISAAGFSSGEDDIENYNAMIEGQIRQKIKFKVLKMIKLKCMNMFGMVPTDLKIEFEPLRVLSTEQEENVKTQQYNRLISAKQAGEIDSEEFRDAVNKANLLPITLDTSKRLLDVMEDNEGDEENDEVPTGKTTPSSVSVAPQAKT